MDPDPARSGKPALLEEDAEDLYENAPCGYLSALLDGTIVKANRAVTVWTGYSKNELLGRRWHHLMTLPGQVFYEAHCVPLIYMQGCFNEMAFDLIPKGGGELPVLVNAVLKKTPTHEPRFLRLTLFNATDRRAYERELLLARRTAEQAARAKSALLSMLSHDLRSPLTTISLAADLLDRNGVPAASQDLLDALKLSSRNILSLLDGILSYSRVEAGHVTLENRNVNFRQLVEDVVRRFQVEAEQKSLELRVRFDERVPTWLLVDSTKMAQILGNLIGNAIKFTHQGAVSLDIELAELSRDAAGLEIQVSDTGIGIPADRREAIFEEFTQASSEIRSQHGGTGLGLAICRRLLELYGSTIAVTSVPGEGSTFSFRLRLALGAAPPLGAALP